jgi:hypothetical protein
MDGQTDTMKLIVAFRSFANTTKTRAFFYVFEVKWHNSSHASIISYKINVTNYVNLNFKLLADEKRLKNRMGGRELSVKVSGKKE